MCLASGCITYSEFFGQCFREPERLLFSFRIDLCSGTDSGSAFHKFLVAGSQCAVHLNE